MNVVVLDPIVAALPRPNAGRMPEEAADVMHVAIGDGVIAVHVLRPHAVTGQQHADAAEVSQFAPRD